jgi:hypothetical protein
MGSKQELPRPINSTSKVTRKRRLSQVSDSQDDEEDILIEPTLERRNAVQDGAPFNPVNDRMTRLQIHDIQPSYSLFEKSSESSLLRRSTRLTAAVVPGGMRRKLSGLDSNNHGRPTEATTEKLAFRDARDLYLGIDTEQEETAPSSRTALREAYDAEHTAIFTDF